MEKLCRNCKHYENEIWKEPCKSCVEHMMETVTVERPNWEDADELTVKPKRFLWVLINDWKIGDSEVQEDIEFFDTYAKAFERYEYLSKTLDPCYADKNIKSAYKICRYSYDMPRDEVFNYD